MLPLAIDEIGIHNIRDAASDTESISCYPHNPGISLRSLAIWMWFPNIHNSSSSIPSVIFYPPIMVFSSWLMMPMPTDN